MFERILLATDLADRTAGATDHARSLARCTGAHVVALHVVEPLAGEPDEEIRAFHATLEKRATARLEQVVAPWQEDGLSVEPVVRLGPRWRTILDVAEERNCDLIVLGSRPTMRDGRPVMGTTSHKVFFATSRPLLVVRTHLADSDGTVL